MGGRLTAGGMAMPLRIPCCAVQASAASPSVASGSAPETVSAIAGRWHPPYAVLTR